MMLHFLANKRVLLGITGSIAAYKSADLVRRLREVGAEVRVAMTENAKQFITPLTMQAVSGYPVHDQLFDLQAEAAMGHIELARWADLVLIAPASADCLARLAHGFADDLLTTLCLATKSPIAVAPAMNQGMWRHLLTQDNLNALKQKGVHMIGPGEGSQACGDTGPGRMLEPQEILQEVANIFASGQLFGLKVLITAGPTHEAIDPVRYISNASSGKMGYALAQAAREAGAEVTLISGPVSIKNPPYVTCLPVITAEEMYAAVMQHVLACDIFLGVAAVADYRPEKQASSKIAKNEKMMQLNLTRNPDIISAVAELTPRPFVVGFAAQTEDVLTKARVKRKQKKMDMIIANQVGLGLGFNSDDNAVTVISEMHEVTLPRTSKSALARQLITLIATELRGQKHDQ